MLLSPYRALWKLPKSLWVLFLTMLINRFGTMVLPFLTIYLTTHKGFSAKEAGLVFSIYGLTSILASPFSGALGDKLGAEKILYSCLFITSVVLFLFPYANSFLEIILATVFFAAFNEFFRPVIFTLASRLSSENEQRQAVVLIRLGANMGMSIGPALGGWLIRHSYQSLFYVDGATALISGLLVFVYFTFLQNKPLDCKESTTEARSSVLQNLLIAWKNPKFVRYWIGISLLATVFFQHECTWPLIMVKDYGLPESIYGFMFTLNTVIIILCEVPLLTHFAHIPHSRFFMLGTLLVTLGISAISLTNTASGIYLLTFLFTFGEMFTFPIGTSFVTSIAPKQKIGSFMGAYNMAFNISLVIAPLLGTFLLDSYGLASFSIAMALLGVSSFLLLRKT